MFSERRVSASIDRMLCEPDAIASQSVKTIRYEKWEKDPHGYIKMDNTKKDFYDFVKQAPTPFDVFEREFEVMSVDFLKHHDLARWQDNDWAVTQATFPRGHFACVQDFSENYHHQHRLEHQSKYFNEISSTVYGCVVRAHLADLSDEFIGGAARRAELMAEFTKTARDVEIDDDIVTFTMVAISADRHHDAVFVKTFNIRLIEFSRVLRHQESSLQRCTPDPMAAKPNTSARSTLCLYQHASALLGEV